MTDEPAGSAEGPHSQVLRALDERDLDDLLVLQREGAVAGMGHIFPQDIHPFPTQEVRSRWLRELDDTDIDCFAILDHGQLAGFAATRAAELLHFGTAVRAWGTGLAGRAHDEIVEHFRTRGHRAAWLRVFDENVRAIRFYRRRGWAPTEDTTRSTFAPYPTLRRYERPLT